MNTLKLLRELTDKARQSTESRQQLDQDGGQAYNDASDVELDDLRDLSLAARERIPALISIAEAAQAVVERWDTPLWKDVPATAVFIEELRRRLLDLGE